MNTIPAALYYHGKPLTPTFHYTMPTLAPSLRALRIVRHDLLHARTQYGSIQPGDGTRYDLVLAPIVDAGGQRGLVVTRLRGGDVVASAVLWDWHTGASELQIDSAGAALSDGNEWTARVLTWWLALVCDPATGSDADA